MTELILPAAYYAQLAQGGAPLQQALGALLERYAIQIIGRGYIDVIVPVKPALALLEELTSLKIAVEYVTWWCLCTPESQQAAGCPHGMGGPRTLDGRGWLSECAYPDFQPALSHSPASAAEHSAHMCNRQVHTYLTSTLPGEPFYSPCLQPGLWLAVPEHWTRLTAAGQSPPA